MEVSTLVLVDAIGLHWFIFFAVERIRGYCGNVSVASAKCCCVDIRTSGSLKKLDVSVPNPERLVGFESLGGSDGDGMFRGLWPKLRESSRIERACPILVGGEDCIVCIVGCCEPAQLGQQCCVDVAARPKQNPRLGYTKRCSARTTGA